MEIIKWVEQFDCSTFKVGTSYFIDMTYKEKRYKGIFICTQINYPYNEVVLYRVVNVCNADNYQEILLTKDNYDMIKFIEPVTYLVEIADKELQGIPQTMYKINATICERSDDNVY